MKLNMSWRIDAPAAQVWSLIADGYGDVGHWTGILKTSYLKAPGWPVEVGAERVCVLPNGITVTETLTELSPETRTLAYRADDVPWPFTATTNRWTLHEAGPGACRATSEVQGGVVRVMRPLTPLFRALVRRSCNRFIDDLRDQLAQPGDRDAATPSGGHPQTASPAE